MIHLYTRNRDQGKWNLKVLATMAGQRSGSQAHDQLVEFLAAVAFPGQDDRQSKTGKPDQAAQAHRPTAAYIFVDTLHMGVAMGMGLSSLNSHLVLNPLTN